MAVWTRINTLLLLLVLVALVALTGMFAAGALGGPLDPPGPPAATDSVRLPGTPIDGPTVITQPGHYYLTRNITVPPQGIGVQISSDDVSLDLGGFTIADPVGNFSSGIFLDAQRRIVISNGNIVGSEVGVDADNARRVHISGIGVYNTSGAGFQLGGLTVLEDCFAVDNLNAIEITDANTAVRNCFIDGPGEAGVLVDAGAALIEGSVIKNNTNPIGAGIVLNNNQATVRDNDMSFNDIDVRVFGADNVIVDNMLSCPTSIVLEVGSSNTFAPVNSTDPHTNRAHRSAC